MGYCASERSKWLHISQHLFFFFPGVFCDRGLVEVRKHAKKKNELKIDCSQREGKLFYVRNMSTWTEEQICSKFTPIK